MQRPQLTKVNAIIAATVIAAAAGVVTVSVSSNCAEAKTTKPCCSQMNAKGCSRKC